MYQANQQKLAQARHTFRVSSLSVVVARRREGEREGRRESICCTFVVWDAWGKLLREGGIERWKELNEKGREGKRKRNCAEAQVLCLVAADEVWGGLKLQPSPHHCTRRKGRQEAQKPATRHGHRRPRFKDRRTRKCPFLVVSSRLPPLAAATATSQPTAAAPRSTIARREGWGRGGGERTPHRARPTFSILPFSSLLTAASPLLHHNCSRQPFFFSFFRSLISVRNSSVSQRRVFFFLFFCGVDTIFFSFSWYHYYNYFSRFLLLFFFLLTGVYRTSALILLLLPLHHPIIRNFFFLPFPLCVSCTIQILPCSHLVRCLFSCGVFAWSCRYKRK